MPKPSKKQNKIDAKDYRHTGQKRKNIPPAKIASEGQVPKVQKVRYYYSPHLSPELRFDPTGKTDHLIAVREKASPYLSKDELAALEAVAKNNEPWLEWAAKKEQQDRAFFEVDPVALHIHERVSTQAILRSAMREDIQRNLFADSEMEYSKAVQFYQHDIDWTNRLILGDSLQVMSSLARRENLAGKVQMIYIDPPYGIRFSSNFQSEVGKRDVKDRDADLTREAETVRAYRDTWRLGIHSYLSYLRDRLIVARELLSLTGSIFVQINDENLHRVRSLMDEAFSIRNFVGLITVKKTAYQASNTIASVADYLLWYSRDIDSCKVKQLYISKEEIESADLYRYSERDNGEELPFGQVEDDEQNNRNRYALISTISQGAGAISAPFVFQRGSWSAPSNCHWKTTIDGLARMALANRLVISGKSIRWKGYIRDFPVSPINNIWTDTMTGSFTDPKAYVVQTNKKIVERCVLMSTDPGDLVLDPTCGSGTTAHVAEQWGRRWITIDTSRVAVAIARQRILTSKYEYYKLRDESKGIAGGFIYKRVPHITLKSIAQNMNLDPIFAKHEAILEQTLNVCNQALSGVSDSVREKLEQRLLEKQKREGKRSVKDADERRWKLPKKGEKWEHWQVPFDTDPDWPKALQDAVLSYRKAWRAKMDEVNACISAGAEQEELVDQPEIVRNVIRVSGPFTVEGVRPEELSLGEDGLFDSTPDEEDIVEESPVRDDVQNLQAYLSRMVELIRKDGITFPNNKHLEFVRFEALFQEKIGAPIHAEGIWEGTNSNEANNVAIAFGPQYGPVTAIQVEDLIRASRRYDELVIAGFSFDAEASVTIQESQHPKLKIHMAHIRPDVSPGMDGLLKETPNSQLFTVFGQPEVKVHQGQNEDFTVELLGVDIFDPIKGEVTSTGAEKVAAWFLDSDYDGRCFCITQAFFPDQDAWDKIVKSLGSSADPEAFEAFKGTVSLPFKAGKYKKIAVKVIDPRGNEVMTFASLKQ